MANPREKFQGLLRKLFQFDCAELDFGIYRIMNHKRDVIEKFIENKKGDACQYKIPHDSDPKDNGDSCCYFFHNTNIHWLLPQKN